MTRGKIIAGVIVLVLIAAVVGGVLYSSAASAPLVTTAAATTSTLNVTVTASGKVEAASRADVYPPAAGTISHVSVSDGDKVRAGQTLAVMDTSPLKVQLAQARSALAAARAQKDAITRGLPTSSDKAAASAGVSAAHAAYDTAKSAESAFSSALDAAPPAARASMEATLTQLVLARKQAYAAYLSAKASSAKLTGAAKVSAARASADAAIDAAQASVSYAESVLDAAKLTAPISGVVVFNATGAPGTDAALPKAQEGSALAPGTAAFSVIDTASVAFDAQVDEADIAKVGSGMHAKVSLDAFPSTTFSGTVSVVKPTSVQTTTGGIAFPVLITLDPASSRVLLGMSGSADIEVSGVEGALTVPVEAVLDEGGAKYVYTISGTTVHKATVTTGEVTDTTAQILSGIQAGQRVVTSQLTTLKDGMTVRVR